VPDGVITPDEIHTRSVDKKGHRVQVQVSLPPEVSREVGEIVASRRTGYKTPQDFVRDAVVHRLAYWAKRLDDPAIERVVDLEVQECRAEKLAAEMDAWDRILETHKQNYVRAQRIGSDFKTMQVIYDLEALLENDALDPAYAREIRAIIDFHYDKK
jgi:hypothetical protein